eukprot:CAMPEP_0182574616 /NCGR_PEP_ID=MMETSP1324-20130603/26435_1 /TAXON_ID=236786 /ORGANISM="Florenciella sp., Strain RCC1587" /LENGTH=131 /DNA_ID=CAMNT_0024790043 /DNA_START=45 /DNA_END=437 /DNA_ORIENTATION=+
MRRTLVIPVLALGLVANSVALVGPAAPLRPYQPRADGSQLRMGMVTPGAGAGAGAAGHAAVPGHVRPFETVSAEAVDGAAQQGDAQGAARQGRGGADAGQPNKKLKLRTVVLQTPSDSMRSRTREDRRGGA